MIPLADSDDDNTAKAKRQAKIRKAKPLKKTKLKNLKTIKNQKAAKPPKVKGDLCDVFPKLKIAYKVVLLGRIVVCFSINDNKGNDPEFWPFFIDCMTINLGGWGQVGAAANAGDGILRGEVPPTSTVMKQFNRMKRSCIVKQISTFF